MTGDSHWLYRLGDDDAAPPEGLVFVRGYANEGSPDEIAAIEKAKEYQADAVFFEAARDGHAPVPQAFVYFSEQVESDAAFAELHKRLWSWGGVPLLYRKKRGVVQLFRCAHKPDFLSPTGEIVCEPAKVLELASLISSAEAWWSSSQLRNGTLWQDPSIAREFLDGDKAAHKTLLRAIEDLSSDLNDEGILRKHLRRKLLIVSMLIAYLEEREVFAEGYFGRFLPNASRFFQVLGNGPALVSLLAALEERFNGNVFLLSDTDSDHLKESTQLARFARMVEGRSETNGQTTLWKLYSFKDLPVELISTIYQLFVDDVDSSVYTPPFLVRLMLDEALSWERLDRLLQSDEVILDPSCGSGVFLVEAYKRLVLHWRSRNQWRRPTVAVLRALLQRVHGIDLEAGAIELAAFSLCLALCDALQPADIRASIKLFPLLAGRTLHHSCFFEAVQNGIVKESVGVIVGNPPFKSALTTPGAISAYERYSSDLGTLPDKQLAYLFLHESMKLVSKGGVLSMLQQYNLLYNQQSVPFRRTFLKAWDVREILDFVSVRGLFKRGDADTKVLVVVAEARPAKPDRKLLHVTFRRSARTDAGLSFDVDYYDLHWHEHEAVVNNDSIWRSDLLGGGRVIDFVNRLRMFPTIKDYAAEKHWSAGEGFIVGKTGRRLPAPHLTGKRFVPSDAITETGIDRTKFGKVDAREFKTAYTPERYSSPMILIREQMDLMHAYWGDGYLTFKNKVVGISGKPSDAKELQKLSDWLATNRLVLKAYAAATSVRMFTQKATTLSELDILSLPCPRNGDLDLSDNERLIAEDIVDYYSDLVRLGEKSRAMVEPSNVGLADYTATFASQINSIYRKSNLRPLQPQRWPGIVCQPFVFGTGAVAWSDSDALLKHLGNLLKERASESLQVTRIARVYDGHFVFCIKPDRLRYWLRSIALRDADEMIADLRAQSF